MNLLVNDKMQRVVWGAHRAECTLLIFKSIVFFFLFLEKKTIEQKSYIVNATTGG